jgi:hypothetical protein
VTAASPKEKLKVLITVKTYPIPSKKYDELVCTAGVTEEGDFVRFYPINFRELAYSQQYKKYQWIEVVAEKHRGRDVRKESYRPDCDSIQPIGRPIPSSPDNWARRARYVLRKRSRSMEDLYARQEADRTSLGIFRPKKVTDLAISPAEAAWSPRFLQALQQRRLFEYRQKTLVPPPRVPFKFHYCFECDDPRCRRNHRMMIEDWELGARFWRMVDQYRMSHRDAAEEVRNHFLKDLCAADKTTYFYVGTILAHPKNWVVIGLFYPKAETSPTGNLFT